MPAGDVDDAQARVRQSYGAVDEDPLVVRARYLMARIMCWSCRGLTGSPDQFTTPAMPHIG
jgi:hypothetical protein